MAQGAFFGMAAVYGALAGLPVRDISLFIGAVFLGGVLLQWPIGRLSDAFDRRLVLTAVTLLAAVCALGAQNLAGASMSGLLMMVLLFGGMSLPMYSLCIAYTNDFLQPSQMVEASGTLLLVGGLGACLGPVSTAAAMDWFGPAGFFGWLALIHGMIGLFALWRMTRRSSPKEQSAFVAVPPRSTAVASALYTEAAGEEPAAEAPSQGPITEANRLVS
jgi:MFS family permease